MTNILAIAPGLTAQWLLGSGRAAKPILRLSGMAMEGREAKVVNLEFTRDAILALNEACERALAQVQEVT